MPEVESETRFMPLKGPWRSALFWDLENLGLHLLRGSALEYRVLRYDDLASLYTKQRLPGIGASLGVDWRRLIGPVKALLDQGTVEKVESRYYPAG